MDFFKNSYINDEPLSRVMVYFYTLAPGFHLYNCHVPQGSLNEFFPNCSSGEEIIPGYFNNTTTYFT